MNRRDLVKSGILAAAFILAHLGNFASRDWREHVRAIEAAKRLPNLYLDTSSVVFFEHLEQAARELPAEPVVNAKCKLTNANGKLQKASFGSVNARAPFTRRRPNNEALITTDTGKLAFYILQFAFCTRS